jgi:hypothetical protein
LIHVHSHQAGWTSLKQLRYRAQRPLFFWGNKVPVDPNYGADFGLPNELPRVVIAVRHPITTPRIYLY